jgi:hypothetical protein
VVNLLRVIIENTAVRIAPFAGYRNKYAGEVGVIEKEFLANSCSKDKKVGVRLNNYTNGSSKYGLFWFDADKLENIEDYESEETKVMLKGFKVAGIRFLEGSNTDNIYAYALYDNEIKEDDIVVVQSGHHGLGIAKVACIDEYASPNEVQCGREIIAKVDFTAFNERKEKAAKLAKLKKEMDKKVKELQSTALYEMLADKDPALKEMLEEFKALSE